MKKAISFNNVTFDYSAGDKGSIRALDSLSLEINEGEFVAVIGHNGSGKSTFAKLLNGLLVPLSGTVNIFGYNTAEKKSVYEVRKRVGMVFQNPDNQMVATIVEDDIAFGAENLGVERNEIIRRVEWALKTVGMSEHRKSTPFRMSGGQKQRVAIAGVLAMLPKIMVLDESTAMLDPKGRSEIIKVAKELNQKYAMTIVLITHFMDEALIADRLLVLNNGKIAADDTPRRVFSDYEAMKELDLSIPIITKIAIMLEKCGMPLAKDTVDIEELAKALVKELSR